MFTSTMTGGTVQYTGVLLSP